MSELLDSISKLAADVKKASVTMSNREAAFLVRTYYRMQRNRTISESQARALNQSGTPHDVIQWLADQNWTLEQNLYRCLNVYSMSHPVGQWARRIIGIGPALGAGLLANIDITKAPTAGHIWSFAGLHTNVKWEKGQKRPFNPDMKLLCWNCFPELNLAQNILCQKDTQLLSFTDLWFLFHVLVGLPRQTPTGAVD